MRSAVNIVYRWVLGAKDKAQSLVSRSLDKLHIGTPRDREGDTPGNVSGVPAGGVAWPVNPDDHDGAAFMGADAFFAYYDAKKREVYMLDDINGTRHRGAFPLKVGRNVFIEGSKKRSGRGTVKRTSEYGTAGIAKNIFTHTRADLIAHHLDPDQPDNSSLVGDPDEVSDRQGGLHYPLRVREWVRKFCSGATQVAKEKLFAPLLNMRLKNGDGTDAGGGATFARGEAALSDEAKGPLACADDGNHRLGVTSEATIHQGANAIDVLYGPVRKLYGPEELVDEQWLSGSVGPFIMRTEKRPDFNALHRNYCKKLVPLVLKWLSYSMNREYPPTIKEPPPKTPPDEPPKEPPPGRPPAMLVPPESAPPTNASPLELEAPSRYGHSAPALPDGEPDRQPSDAPGDALPEHPSDLYWLDRLGFTEREWNNFSNICTHEFVMPVYQSTSRGNASNPWPTVNNFREGKLQFDAQGNIIARDANLGNGTVIDGPAWARPWHALRAEWSQEWRESQHARIIMAGKNSAGTTVDGRFGLGSRYLTSPFTISGFEFKLDTSSSATEPDLVLSPKNASGAESGAGVFHVQTGVQVDDYLLAGAVGAEADAIRIDNTTTRGRIRASDFGTKAAHIIAHQHSTTVAPKLYLSRSNSNSSSHTAVTNSQELGSIVALGWAHSTPGYLPAAQIKMSVDASGTVGSGSMPGKIELQTTQDSAKTPTTAVLIDSAQTVFVRQPKSTAPVTVIESAASDGVRRETYLSRATTLSAGVTPVNVLTLAPTEVCRLRVSITAAEESGGTDQDYAYEALLKVTEVSGALSIGTAAVLLNDGSAAFAITYADGGSGVLQINVDDTGAYNMLWNIIIEVDRNTRV